MHANTQSTAVLIHSCMLPLSKKDDLWLYIQWRKTNKVTCCHLSVIVLALVRLVPKAATIVNSFPAASGCATLAHSRPYLVHPHLYCVCVCVALRFECQDALLSPPWKLFVSFSAWTHRPDSWTKSMCSPCHKQTSNIRH